MNDKEMSCGENDGKRSPSREENENDVRSGEVRIFTL